MKLTKRDFKLRDEDEQEMLIADAWCSVCNDTNLGLVDPIEYEGNGLTFLEGKCAECGESVISTITV